MALLSRIIDWLRAGYPSGVPDHDYVHLLAVLGRRLTDEEVEEIAREMQSQGLTPMDRVDVGVGISRVTDELPSVADVERVMRHLVENGYPVLDAEFDRLTEDITELPGGFVVARVRPKKALEIGGVIDLYTAVGWSAYTSDPEGLQRALRRSHRVVAAWDKDKRLVGLARSISDKATICYVQDILVHPDVQRMGVGKALVERLLSEYPDIRQTVLMTDGSPEQKAFYAALGFTELPASNPPLTAFAKLR